MNITDTPNPVPQRLCDCGDFLPHYCGEVVTVTRERWTGKRIVTITPRTAVTGERAA